MNLFAREEDATYSICKAIYSMHQVCMTENYAKLCLVIFLTCFIIEIRKVGTTWDRIL